MLTAIVNHNSTACTIVFTVHYFSTRGTRFITNGMVLVIVLLYKLVELQVIYDLRFIYGLIQNKLKFAWIKK